MAGTTFEHSFHQNGSVTWLMADGQHKGATRTEKSYAAVRMNDRTWAVSYLSASGHTLTVVLNLDDGHVVGFASDNNSWYSLNGTFELVN